MPPAQRLPAGTCAPLPGVEQVHSVHLQVLTNPRSNPVLRTIICCLLSVLAIAIGGCGAGRVADVPATDGGGEYGLPLP